MREVKESELFCKCDDLEFVWFPKAPKVHWNCEVSRQFKMNFQSI